jgi:AI-2 transport protein TqsA
MSESKKYLPWQNIALPILAIAGATLLFYYASFMLIPLVASISFAFVLSPAVSFLRKLKIPHFLAVILPLLFSVVIFGLFGYLIFLQAQGLILDLPNYWSGFLDFLGQAKGTLNSAIQGLGGKEIQAENFLQNLKLQDFSGITKFMVKGLGSAISLFFTGFLTIFLTFFILNDQKGIKNKIIKALGSSQEEIANKVLNEINNRIKDFILVKFLITVGLAIVFTVGLLIIGVNYAYLWGPLAAVLNLVPFVGPIIALIPPLVVAGIQFGNIMPLVWILLFYVTVQNLENYVISPKLLGSKIDLSPLVVLISTMYWGWLWGAMGVILAIPITAAVKVVCDHVKTLEPIGIMLSSGKELS